MTTMVRPLHLTLLPALIAIFSIQHGEATPLNIAAFNIRDLGDKKMADKKVPDTLVKIIRQYDLVLVQEIRTVAASQSLLAKLNDGLETKEEYGLAISPRLGEAPRYEYYGYYYKKATLTVDDEYQYDVTSKLFARPPFIVTFSAPNSVIGTFAFCGIHTKPQAEDDITVDEIDSLVTVYDECRKGAKGPVPTDDWIFGGDFNADSVYVTSDDFKNIRLYTDNRFHWVIDTGVDTTVSKKNKFTYDRLVLTGRVDDQFVLGSAKAFNFRDEYKLTQKYAEKVSDHFPVVMKLN